MWVWYIWMWHDLTSYIRFYIYLKILTFALRKESFLTFSTREVGGASLIEGIARGRSWWERASLTYSFTHSLTPVMKLYWERNACVRQSLSSISLKTGKFPSSFNSKTSVYTKQSNIWQHLQVLVSWSRFIEALEKHCSVRVNWCQTCAFEIMLFISQLFLLDRLSLPFQTQH